jgi:demethoxyubiquinone hydroxylase (CLK1/Coq7/Cat5 family)
MSWLQAVADRAACGLISIEGSTLYAEELAKSVKQHFADVLQKLVPADDEAEELMEPETDDDAA